MFGKMNKAAAIKAAKALIDIFPTSGFELGLADYNNNGVPDFRLRLLLNGGGHFDIGPIDIPGSDADSFIDVIGNLLPGD